MRPFTWPHVVVPLLPSGLIEVLDAPVPILVGMPPFPGVQPHKFPDLIWVLPDSSGKGSRIVCGNKAVLAGVAEPSAHNLRSHLRSVYASLSDPDTIFTFDSSQLVPVYQVANLFHSYYESLVALIPEQLERQEGGLLDVQKLQATVLGRVEKEDLAFVSAFTATQVFLIHVEERARVLHSPLFLSN